jgi:hypothetical protein
MRIFDWYFSGKDEYRNPLFHLEPGANLDQVKLMFEESRLHFRTANLRHHERLERCAPSERPADLRSHPHSSAARDVPKGPSNLTFVTDGIASAIRQARAVADGKEIKLGGASPGHQALKTGLCDEILIHLAPHLLGDGVRLFDHLGGPVRLKTISAADGPLAMHVRYSVVKA